MTIIHDRSLSDAEARNANLPGRLALEVTSAITYYMRKRGIHRRDLADSLGVTPGRVSQILTGGQNLTLKTLESIEDALDAEFEVSLNPRARDS